MAFLNDKNVARALVAAVVIAIAAAVLVFGGYFTRRPPPPEIVYETVGVAIEPLTYADLDGWRADDVSEALAAFARSCEKLLSFGDGAPANPDEQLGPDAGAATLAGAAGDWRAPCDGAAAMLGQNFADANARASAARSFYENHFHPFRLAARQEPGPGAPQGARGRLEPKGRFTGYFEPTYRASREQTVQFAAPVLARPEDLVMVDLGRFRPELAGQRIAGRVVDGALDPYPTHAEINAGALAERTQILGYMRPTDLLFLQIQGSGRLSFPDGEIRVGYDGANGRPYTAVGKTLIASGALPRESVSMQTIRGWLDAAPAADAARVRESNESYVFFRRLDGLADPLLGPLGAQEVQLTGGRSIAVDKRYTPLGAPVWISIDGEDGKAPIRRLFIAQDTGGAIKGPVRGDLFIGAGEEAGEAAGVFNETGEMIVLLPKAVAERLLRSKALLARRAQKREPVLREGARQNDRLIIGRDGLGEAP